MEEPVKFDVEIDESVTLAELIDVPILQQMQDAFSKMARMAALTTDSDGVALTEGSNFSELCMGYCRKSDIGRERCENCDKMGAVMSLEQKKPISYRCHANLVDFAAPIMLGDRMIGSFIGGQVLPEAIDEDKMRQVAREIEVDEEGFLEAARKTQIIPQAAIDRSTVFLYEFAKIMSDMAYNAYLSKQLSKEAMQAAIQKQDFLANMSHEIRTPMNAILGFTNMGLKYIDDKEKVTECLTKAQQSGGLLLSLINNVLDISRIESNKVVAEQNPGDIYLSFSTIENTMKELASTKNIEVTFEVSDIQDRYVYADFNKCIRIFTNLISNAIKYNNEGGKVHASCKQIGGNVNGYGIYQFVIEDNGFGMSEEFQRKIFEPFERETTSTISRTQGTGLGMSICKQLVDLMKGTIEVTSVEGKGTKFVLNIPFRMNKEVKPIIKEEIADDVSIAGTKILLVEDNELNMEIACSILETFDVNITKVFNGQEAVDAFANNAPQTFDVILMDIMMPILNGYDATRAIRKLDREDAKQIPIIAMTANAFEEDRRDAIEAGMNGHLAKPINIKLLIETLSQFM